MLNGKYKCLFWFGNAFKKGEIYDFKDGKTTAENCFNVDIPLSVEESPFFKFEKIELPQPHKSLLKSGDKVVYRCETIRYVLLEINELVSKRSNGYNNLDAYDEDLKTSVYENDIMEIWRGDELIAKRIEKSEKEIEIERIENEMRKLADDLRKVKGE